MIVPKRDPMYTTPHIFDILLKFRSYPTGIVADMEKAFHQIVVIPKDLTWFDSCGLTILACKIQYQFYHLVFGLTSSSAVLNKTIHHHITHYLLIEPLIAEILFYVNDFTIGTQTIEE